MNVCAMATTHIQMAVWRPTRRRTSAGSLSHSILLLPPFISSSIPLPPAAGGGGAMRMAATGVLRSRGCFLCSQLLSFPSRSIASDVTGNSRKEEKKLLRYGPGLFSFTHKQHNLPPQSIPSSPAGRIYYETYGCQMNVNDMEIVLAIMKDAGYTRIMDKPEEADVIFVNTCAIRENAEHKIWHRLNYFKYLKRTWKKTADTFPEKPKFPPKVAVLGCMAERLKEKLIDADKMVDVVCGPDAYRDLPRLLALVDEGQTGINTLLSLEETYADVSPIRISKSSITAFISIMRGCNNMCSYCIVPFTRGRERSRPVSSIIREVGELWSQGVKEVMLLGQNVNSYNDTSGGYEEHCQSSTESYQGPAKMAVTGGTGVHNNLISKSDGNQKVKFFESDLLSPGFTSIYRVKEGGLRFSNLLNHLSECYPEMRFRFTSPHPKDFPDDLLYIMRDCPNICKSIHLPAQSGSTRMLEKMRRGYDREAYLLLVDRIRAILPDVGISSDFIAGFCGETEEDHEETLSLIEAVEYDMAYMFAYSSREKTYAHRTFEDDVPEDVKQRRLSELIATFRRTTSGRFASQIGTTQLVLVEGPNKRDPENELIGRSDKGHKVIFPNMSVCSRLSQQQPVTSNSRARYDAPLDKNTTNTNSEETETCPASTEAPQVLSIPGALKNLAFLDLSCDPRKTDESTLKPGDYVAVKIRETSLASLRGLPLYKTDIMTFYDRACHPKVSLPVI
ncbi:hypothetical protein O6H91_02G047400 [Diphasiastrum complanatum]|uniref:Uncharacterized protein n=1 Tax=Diphasiastrum complanatum TaxID=34168 RepID=A0ACC2EF21_DIPCM|nr:hypothetical protein O6H91_02G047400 [Diphasiastrum complanatum]